MTTRTLRTAALAALATAALAGPATGIAHAQPNNGGGSGGASCTYKDGSKAAPGDTMTHNRTITVKGRKFVSTDHFICGEDGQWHPVVELRAGHQGNVQPTTVKASARRVA